MSDYTNEELIALKKAYAQGVRVVQYADKRLEYDSGDQIMQRIRAIEAELGVSRKRGGRRFAEFNKGLG